MENKERKVTGVRGKAREDNLFDGGPAGRKAGVGRNAANAGKGSGRTRKMWKN
jgi:hypothetical protein